MAISVDPAPVFRQFIALLPPHWSRQRGSLGPPQVMLSLMTMTVLGCQGYERTLDEMKDRLGDALGWKCADDVPSPSALSQARVKLTAARCESIVAEVYAMCTAARACASLGYGGFRLLALDGTRLALPAYAAMRKHFGCPSQGEGRELSGPQAALTVLWDIGANQPVAWRVGTYKTSEQEHADELVGSIGPGDLVLGDRNFPSRRFLTALHRKQAEVLVRMRTTGVGVMHEVADFIASESIDAVVQMEAWDERNRPIEGRQAIPVRLLRVTLPDASVAVYLTSLRDPARHPASALIDLYAQRWRIETAFRELKIWHGLERFHSRRVAGIAQEIAAVMIFQLLASELEAKARVEHHLAQAATPPNDGQPLAPQAPQVRFNRRIVADCVVRIMYTAASGRDIHEAYSYAMFRIWRYRQKVRPGRSFPRQRKSAPRGWKPRGTKGKGRP